MKKIALDVDGILANFYLAICIKYNKPYSSISNWQIPWFTEQMWQEVKKDSSFWMELPILNRPEAITFDFDCYMTALPPEMLRERSYWLGYNGFPKKPVIVSDNKLETCVNMGIDLLIDDKPQTVLQFRDTKNFSPEIIYYKPHYYLNMDIEGVPNITHLDEVNIYL